jgi:hypothetical protein
MNTKSNFAVMINAENEEEVGRYRCLHFDNALRCELITIHHEHSRVIIPNEDITLRDLKRPGVRELKGAPYIWRSLVRSGAKNDNIIR